MTPITVSRTAGEVAVVASGLAPGMRVVTDGQSRLTPGAQVVIKGPGGGAGRPGGTPEGA
jgi:multidrug efflux system membrane fusion protein